MVRKTLLHTCPVQAILPYGAMTEARRGDRNTFLTKTGMLKSTGLHRQQARHPSINNLGWRDFREKPSRHSYSKQLLVAL